MNKLKEQIETLRIHLAEIQTQLEPLLNKSAKQEVQSQLNAIVQSTDRLTKTEVNIPIELRELKFKLIKEIDKYNEAEDLQKEVLEILNQYGSFKQTNKVKTAVVKESHERTRVTTPQFDLSELINSGLLPVNTKIIKNYKGTKYTAIITKEGKIKTNYNNEVILHNSLTTAAVYITQKSQNGWAWWGVEGDVNNRTLDYYRQQYLKYKK